MRRLTLQLRIPAAIVFCLVLGAGSAQVVRAQDGSAKPDHSITHLGHSGLFNLVTPDTLDQGQVSFGMVHHNYDREISDLDVNDLAAAFGIGVTSRLEVGMSYIANRQTDYDERDLNGFDNELPFEVPTIDNGGGDLLAGLKYSIVRIEEHGNGLALYGRVKVPTGNEDHGRGTGGYDVSIGATGGMVRGSFGFYGSGGYTFVGDGKSLNGDLDLANELNYGIGIELGARSWVKGIAEITGKHFVNEETLFVRSDGSLGGQEDIADLAVGFKLGGAKHSGFTFGAAYVRNLTMEDHRPGGQPTYPNGWVAELSYTSSERPIPLPPPVEPTPDNHPPTCSLTVTPAEVYPSFSSKTHAATVTAQGANPDGDTLSYAWTTTGGAVSGSGSSITWTGADGVEDGAFTVTARVTDGRGGEGTCAGSVKVRPDPEHFEGRVQFEFDRYDLTDEARTVIQKAAAHLKRFPTLKVSIEGHCCYIATEEYNLQLGQQRAESIRTYLGTLGVDATRLSTISYGETRPWQDNTRELTRRLNRRGEFRFKFAE